MSPLTTVELLTFDASALAKLLADGRITSQSLVEQILTQINNEDKAGAKLQAILNVAPRDKLLSTAAQLDEERRAGKLRGPLHGIPILIKDAIATHPDLGLPTTVGSYALLNSRPARNAPLVDELIKNGLIILAKTNLNEFCNWKGFNSINGFSVVGGQTNSAYIAGGLKEGESPMGHTSPLGSSTGSAVGVSAGYSPLSLGTETDGSLVQPAGRAALYALKPTVGSTNTSGVWTLSTRFDSVGAMAKSVSDLALVTEMLHTKDVRAKLPPSGYTSYLTKSFKGMKVGFVDPTIWHLPPSMCPQIPHVVEQLNGAYFKAIEKIKDAGAHIEYPVKLPGLESLLMDGKPAMSVILLHDYKKNVDSYLGDLEYSEVRNLKELIEWNKEHADIELPFNHTNQERLIMAYNNIPSEEEYEKAKSHLQRVAVEDGLNKLFGDKGLDIIGIPQDSKISSIASASGYPIATMPLGVLDDIGRPFGLAIMASAGREDKIFEFLSAFEDIFPKRTIPPQLVKEDKEKATGPKI